MRTPAAPGSPERRRWLAAASAEIAEERPRFVNWLPVLFGAGIAARQVAQLAFPVRVGQAAGIENQISVERNPVFERKRLDLYGLMRRGDRFQALFQHFTKVMHRQ